MTDEADKTLDQVHADMSAEHQVIMNKLLTQLSGHTPAVAVAATIAAAAVVAMETNPDQDEVAQNMFLHFVNQVNDSMRTALEVRRSQREANGENDGDTREQSQAVH